MIRSTLKRDFLRERAKETAIKLMPLFSNTRHLMRGKNSKKRYTKIRCKLYGLICCWQPCRFLHMLIFSRKSANSQQFFTRLCAKTLSNWMMQYIPGDCHFFQFHSFSVFYLSMTAWLTKIYGKWEDCFFAHFHILFYNALLSISKGKGFILKCWIFLPSYAVPWKQLQRLHDL